MCLQDGFTNLIQVFQGEMVPDLTAFPRASEKAHFPAQPSPLADSGLRKSKTIFKPKELLLILYSGRVGFRQ